MYDMLSPFTQMLKLPSVHVAKPVGCLVCYGEGQGGGRGARWVHGVGGEERGSERKGKRGRERRETEPEREREGEREGERERLRT
jgi:hypothetical protein